MSDTRTYTEADLRAAAAGEILNCIGFAMDSGVKEVYEWGRVLAIRLPIILEGPEPPQPPNPQNLAEMLAVGRIKLREWEAARGKPQ